MKINLFALTGFGNEAFKALLQNKDIEIKKDRIKIEKLKKITAPFMLRRLKTDKNIAPDLPQKIIIDEYSTMTKEQAGLYQSLVDESFKMMQMKRTQEHWYSN